MTNSGLSPLSQRASTASRASLLIQANSAPTVTVPAAARRTVPPEGEQNRSLRTLDARLERVEGVTNLVTGLIGVGEVGLSIASRFNPEDTPLDMVADSAQGLEIIGTSIDAGVNLIRFAGNTARDIKAYGDRKKLQTLLNDYDPVSHNLGADQLKAATELAQKDGGNRLKSSGDAALDRLIELKRVVIGGQEAVTSGMKLGGLEDPPYLSLAFDAALVVDAGWKLGNASTALTNLRTAVKNSGDNPVLLALANHIENERIFKGRSDVFQGTLSVAKVSFQAAAMVVGGPAGLMIAGAAAGSVAAAAGAGMIYRAYKHANQIDGMRTAAEEQFASLQNNLESKETGQALQGNIGLAERAMLHMLRKGSYTQQAQAAKFLQDFGIKKEIIFGIRVMDEKDATNLLTRALYKERVKSPGFFKSLFSAANWKSFGQIIGLRSRSHRPMGERLQSLSPRASQSLLMSPTASRSSLLNPVNANRLSGNSIGRPSIEIAKSELENEPIDFSSVKPPRRKSVSPPSRSPLELVSSEYRYSAMLEREIDQIRQQGTMSGGSILDSLSVADIPSEPVIENKIAPIVARDEEEVSGLQPLFSDIPDRAEPIPDSPVNPEPPLGDQPDIAS